MSTTISSHNIRAFLGTEELSVETASVTLDEAWAPYAQASLTIALPDTATINALDPRQDVRIQLILTQDYGTSDTLATLTDQFGGGDIADLTTAWGGLFLYEVTAQYYTPYNTFGVRAGNRRVFDLTLRERKINHADATIDLTLSSDEALLQDYALVATSSQTSETTDIRNVVQLVLELIGRLLEPGTVTGTFDIDAGTWEPGQSAWDYLEPIVQASSLRLYCDEKRDWYLVEDQAETPGSITLSYTGTMTGADDTISRDSLDWYDAVVIKYEYVDGAGNTIIEYDTASTTGFSKVLTLTFDTAKPGIGQAARILQRAEGRGRVNEISAISDYSATPGQLATLTMPDTATQIGNIAAVTWNYPDDEMSIKTRGLLEVPDTAWIFTPVGRHWQDVAVGTSWTEYVA